MLRLSNKKTIFRYALLTKGLFVRKIQADWASNEQYSAIRIRNFQALDWQWPEHWQQAAIGLAVHLNQTLDWHYGLNIDTRQQAAIGLDT